MRGILLASLVLALVLIQACGGDADEDGDTPTPGSTPISTTAPSTSSASSSEAIAFAQTYDVPHQVEREDGQWEITVVPLASRVEEYCENEPEWYARDVGKGNWRVFAECQKQEVVLAENPLIFEFLFYPEVDLVLPWNYPAHVAQSDYPWKP
jgi:hypothetical protein